MSVSKSFIAHALDLMELVGPVQGRAMFGGYGLYTGGAMFALLDDDELFLKADAESVDAFVAAGCRQWVFPGPKGPTPGGYWRPPDDAHDDPEGMLPWARLAVEASRRAAAAKARKKNAAPRSKAKPARRSR
jgi:DNA transformation protein